MKIAIAPAGTLGDIRPCVALARGIMKKGHSVIMIVPENGIFICRQYNVPYYKINIDFDLIAEEGKGKRTKSQQISLMHAIIEKQFEEILPALKGCDMLIGASLQMAGLHLAEYLGIPYYHVYYSVRFLESSDFPPLRVSLLSKGYILNKLMWKAYKKLSDKMVAPAINKSRKKLGLNPILPSKLYNKNILIASDKALDPASMTIKAEYRQTGYWNFSEEENTDLSFLNSNKKGRRLVYFGFGSMPYRSADETISTLEKLAGLLDIVFVIPQKLIKEDQFVSNRIIPIGYIPHLQLFPKLDAIIHHGGAGTTHAAALCGIPQIIIPQMSDQFYWEYRAKLLQIAPDLGGITEIEYKTLKMGIEDVLYNNSYRSHANKLCLNRPEKSIDIALDYLGLIIS